MFCVVYEFEVNHDNENEFKQVWHNLTLIIREARGGLGSRLHKDITRDNIWIAYAQWPDKNAWSQPGSSISDKHAELRDRMKAVCVNVRTIYQLDVIDDLLVH
jgi:quinol monooxygenase YgiN